jgi:hypothetical protein
MSTIRVDDQLFKEVEKWAAQSNRSVEAVVEQALRAALPPPRKPRTGPVILPTFGGSGLQPGVDLENRSAILDLLDQKE